VLPDVWAWLAADLAAGRITTTVIRGGRLGAGHGRPARMSGSHAETPMVIFNVPLSCLMNILDKIVARKKIEVAKLNI